MGSTVKRILRRVLRRGSEKGGFQKVPRTPPCRVLLGVRPTNGVFQTSDLGL